MLDLFKKNKFIFISYLIILIIGAFVLLTTDKSDFHYKMNSIVGLGYIDAFFKYITYLGDGYFVINLAIVFILLFNIRNGVLIVVSYITSGLFTTLLKRVFFDDINRPSFVFRYFRHQELNYVDGVQTLIHNSFPSGHSTAAFALFFTLIFISDKPAYKWIFFITAILTAFSRTYLSQHWLVDIYFGSLIGSSFAVFTYLLMKKNKKIEKWNHSLISSFL